MPIILVTGKNGHGKGQFIIREILRLQKENDKREKNGQVRRRIFTNIHGINVYPNKPLIDCEPLPENELIFFGKQDDENNPPPENYFVPPIGSIFIFDEAQEFEWIKNKSGALSKDLRVRSLETHRHAGLDVYFLTQSPNYIHSHIQGLVSPHYYVERSIGLNTSNVFKFGNFQKSPDSPAVKKRADDNSIMKLGKEYGQYYKSSAEHNMKSPLPLKLKIALAVLVGCLAFTYQRMTQAGFIDKETKSITTNSDNQNENDLNANQENIQLQQSNEVNKTELDILKEKHEIETYRRRIYLIQNNLPKDYEIIKSEKALQVRAVISSANKTCQAYNAFGDLMTLSQDDCNYYLQSSGRVHKSNENRVSTDTSFVTPATTQN